MFVVSGIAAISEILARVLFSRFCENKTLSMSLNPIRENKIDSRKFSGWGENGGGGGERVVL